MKHLFSTLLVAAGFSILGMLGACSKDDNNNNNTAPSRTKQIRLYNYSTGSAVDAGSVTFAQLPDSSAAATINLASGYYNSGVNMVASITTTVGTNEFTYAGLNNVLGATGVSTTSPVLGAGNIAIKYDTLISRTGFTVKVTNGVIVQARGTIQ